MIFRLLSYGTTLKATVCLAILIFGRIDGLIVNAQEEQRSYHYFLSSRNESNEVFLGGNVDFGNSFVLLPEPDRYRAYSNLHEVWIQNSSDSPIRNPMILINDSKLWTTPLDIEEGLVIDSDFDETARLLWNRFAGHSVHRYYPYEGFRAGTPVDLLTNFGYGICYNRSAAFTRLPSNEAQVSYDLVSNKHTVSEYKRGGRTAVMDTDLNSFYLDLSNGGLASKYDVSMDRYLIKRTHHYGRQYAYDRVLNEYVAYFYSHNPNNNPESLIEPVDYSLEYDLVPGETLSLDYTPGRFFFSEYFFQANSDEIANGRFSYDWIESSNSYYLQDENLSNLRVENGGIVKSGEDVPAVFSYRLDHGFQIVYLQLYFDFSDRDLSSVHSIQVSSDSITWRSPTSESMEGTMLKAEFDLQAVPYKGRAYVRMTVEDESSKFSLRNFGYTSHFQINRLALPQLKCGSNIIRATHDSPYDVPLSIGISFNERSSDIPAAVDAPVFPSDGEDVFGELGRFSWDHPSSDAEIVNYEFILTSDTLSGMPLAPNFSAYTGAPDYSEVLSLVSNGRTAQSNPISLLNPSEYKRFRYSDNDPGRLSSDTNLTKFVVHEEGFFSSGETYYWRVRPLSASGVWGPWSPYFSFMIRKIMPPVMLEVTESEIRWKPNGQGVPAEHFEVHASNEYLGFEPNESTLLAVTPDTVYDIGDEPFTFYRVIALDSVGLKSEVSEYVSRPYPYVTNRPEDVHVDSAFTYTIEFSEIYYPLVSSEDHYFEIRDSVRFQVVDMPPWLTFNYSNGAFEGIPTREELTRDLNDRLNRIELELMSPVFPATRQFVLDLSYVLPTRPPQFVGIDTVLYCNNDFAFEIMFSDDDIGDSVYFVLRDSPEWLHLRREINHLQFYGTAPATEGLITTSLTGFDANGDSTVAVISLNLVSNKVELQVYATTRQTMGVPIGDIIPSGLSSSSQHAVRLPDFFEGRDVSIEDGHLLLYDDFCEVSYPKLLDIPVMVEVVDGVEVLIEAMIIIVDVDATMVTAFHPHGTDWIQLINVGCHGVDFVYRVLDMLGKTVMSERVELDPEEVRLLYLTGIGSGAYIFDSTPRFSDGGYFRFLIE